VSGEVLRQIAIGDSSSTRTVYVVTIALVAIGVLLLLLAVWLIRQTKPDRELLAPLERMNDRSWQKQDSVSQRRTLDDVRPDGAVPLSPERDVPAIDDEIEQPIPTLNNLDDLHSPPLQEPPGLGAAVVDEG
jgi:hypothetical protein